MRSKELTDTRGKPRGIEIHYGYSADGCNPLVQGRYL